MDDDAGAGVAPYVEEDVDVVVVVVEELAMSVVLPKGNDGVEVRSILVVVMVVRSMLVVAPVVLTLTRCFHDSMRSIRRRQYCQIAPRWSPLLCDIAKRRFSKTKLG